MEHAPVAALSTPLTRAAKVPAGAWGVAQVQRWAAELGLPEDSAQAFASAIAENDVDGAALLALTRAEVKEDLGVKKLGPLKHVMAAIEELKTAPVELPSQKNDDAAPRAPDKPQAKPEPEPEGNGHPADLARASSVAHRQAKASAHRARAVVEEETVAADRELRETQQKIAQLGATHRATVVMSSTPGSSSVGDRGVFFDVRCSGPGVRLTALSGGGCLVFSNGAWNGAADVTIYACHDGSGRGRETDGSAWREVGAGTFKSKQSTRLALSTPLEVPAGATIGLYVHARRGRVELSSKGTLGDVDTGAESNVTVLKGDRTSGGEPFVGPLKSASDGLGCALAGSVEYECDEPEVAPIAPTPAPVRAVLATHEPNEPEPARLDHLEIAQPEPEPEEEEVEEGVPQDPAAALIPLMEMSVEAAAGQRARARSLESRAASRRAGKQNRTQASSFDGGFGGHAYATEDQARREAYAFTQPGVRR
eukprot:COSAG04_NODE_170_length_21634_cov_12.250337_19_plen_481_part_00